MSEREFLNRSSPVLALLGATGTLCDARRGARRGGVGGAVRWQDAGWLGCSGTVRRAIGWRMGRWMGGPARVVRTRFWWTAQAYGDFELEFEVRVDDAAELGRPDPGRGPGSGETGEGPDERAGRVFGPQVEIEASPGLAGYVYGEATGRGWLTPEARRVPHAHFRNGRVEPLPHRGRGAAHPDLGPTDEPIEDLTDEDIYRETHPRASSACRCTASSRARAPTRWRGATCACASCRNDPRATAAAALMGKAAGLAFGIRQRRP